MEPPRADEPHGRHRGTRNSEDLTLALSDLGRRIDSLAAQTSSLEDTLEPASVFIDPYAWRLPPS